MDANIHKFYLCKAICTPLGKKTQHNQNHKIGNQLDTLMYNCSHMELATVQCDVDSCPSL